MDAFQHANTNFSVINHSPHTIHTQPNNNNPTSTKPTHTNTFVHKLFNMVIDDQFQHLIAWSYTGSSFIVCNIMEFSKDVLPKHFKHNNFSSFVRQLNMYGFHKVNKSPRGHRTLAENQIWEFSHQKFLRNRPDLLDDIKRKAMEADTKNTGDMHTHMAMIQMSQSDIIQQINHLYEKFNQVIKELTDAKKKQSSQDYVIKQMLQYITQENGGQLPNEFKNEYTSSIDNNTNHHHHPHHHHNNNSNNNNNTNNNNNSNHPNNSDRTPSIFVTSHESTNEHPSHSFNNSNTHSHHHTLPSPLTVRTQNILSPNNTNSTSSNNYHHTPSTLSPLSTSFNSSISSNSGLLPSDDDASLYSPHTPKDNNSMLFQRHACK
ncbi:unnamed protein product [Cunninghamella blakesleeana]